MAKWVPTWLRQVERVEKENARQAKERVEPVRRAKGAFRQ